MKKNPFVVARNIPSESFCPRKNEVAQLKNQLLKGNNVVLMAERRMGKTALIAKALERKELRNRFQVVTVELLHTTSFAEFVFAFTKSVFDSLCSQGQKALLDYASSLKSLRSQLTLNSGTKKPAFSINLGDIVNPEVTLKEIFSYLGKEEKRVLVVLDGFERVANYEEANSVALLLRLIQQSKNITAIFSGLNREVLQTMCISSEHPCCHDKDVIELGEIPEDDYVKFVEKLFRKSNREIESEAIRAIYRELLGNTFCLQRVFHGAFARTEARARCTKGILETALEEEVLVNGTMYRETLSLLSRRTKEVLYAIAKEGKANHVTSGDFVKRYALFSQSSVQAAIKLLLQREIITRKEKAYSITDKFFSLWIRRELLGV